jgi:non-heme chloroperoxidase
VRTGVFNLLLLVALILFVTSAAFPQAPAGWHDPSPHKVQFVRVQKNVQLEVLDWGGSGRPVVLLAGAGCTAHIFDDFAPKLTDVAHVYGIARRGFGASGRPEMVRDYKQERLAEDVLDVIRALNLQLPVLIGHSMAGGKMATLADQNSDLIGGLVYLDAAGDPQDWPADDPAYMELFKKLPKDESSHHDPTEADLKTFEAYRAWQARDEVAFPESELRNTRATNPAGSVGRSMATPGAWDAIGKGALKRRYSRISVPILAFFPGGDAKPNPAPKNEEERLAIERFNAATQAYVNRWKKNLETAPGGVRMVAVPKANHFFFLSKQDEVMREIRTFLAGLH